MLVQKGSHLAHMAFRQAALVFLKVEFAITLAYNLHHSIMHHRCFSCIVEATYTTHLATS